MLVEFMNQPTKCIACMKGRNKAQDERFKINGNSATRWVPLIKHHVRYEPEMIAYVHYDCHQDIHKGLYPHLIQYQEGESREYYGKQT